MSFTKSENVGSISKEHKGTGPISRLRAFMSHIGYLLTVAPAQYNVFPTPDQFERMKKNQGCGPSGGGSGTNNGPTSDDLHDEELKADRERNKRAADRREKKGNEKITTRNKRTGKPQYDDEHGWN